MPSKIPLGLPNQIHVNRFSSYLSSYPHNLKSFLTNGFTFGFPINSSLTSPPVSSYSNHTSALLHPQLVSSKISKEVALGRVAGPFPSPPFPSFVTSPLGLIPKKVPGEYRLIHDLSFPREFSVNSYIHPSFTKVSYEDLDHCLKIVLSLGPNSLISKADLKDAFRLLPIYPQDYRLLGFKWNNLFYYDKCLPMGCSVSCQLFETFATALHWILTSKLKVPFMSHILDDFIFFGPPQSSRCNQSLQSFLMLCESLQLPIKPEKTVLPSTSVTLHGIEVDTSSMTIRLPQEKLSELRSKVASMSVKKKSTLKDLQSLLGSLNFACRVIVPGRAFLRRLYDLTKSVSNPHHMVRLNKEARADLAAWSLFLQSFNGRVLCLPVKWDDSDALHLYTDASGLAYAAILGASWIQGDFPSSWADVNIAIKELLPIVLAVRLWGSRISNKRILFLTDNQAVVSIINNQTSKDPVMMSLVRSLVVSTLTHNILFAAKHIPGKSNTIADLLSRSQVGQAQAKAPWLDTSQHQVPPDFLPW